MGHVRLCFCVCDGGGEGGGGDDCVGGEMGGGFLIDYVRTRRLLPEKNCRQQQNETEQKFEPR